MKFIHPKNKDIIGLHFDYEQRDGVDVKTTLYLWNISRRELLDGVGYPVSVSRFVGDVPNREIARQVAVRKMLKAFHAEGQREMAKRVGRAYFNRSPKPSKKRLPECVMFKEYREKAEKLQIEEAFLELVESNAPSYMLES